MSAPPVVSWSGRPGPARPRSAGASPIVRLGFRDTDADVEAAARHATVADIFVDSGRGRVPRAGGGRRARALAEHDGVLALGGGAVLDHDTRELLAGHAVVFLDVGLADAANARGLAIATGRCCSGNPRGQLQGAARRSAARSTRGRQPARSTPTDARVDDVVATDGLLRPRCRDATRASPVRRPVPYDVVVGNGAARRGCRASSAQASGGSPWSHQAAVTDLADAVWRAPRRRRSRRESHRPCPDGEAAKTARGRRRVPGTRSARPARPAATRSSASAAERPPTSPASSPRPGCAACGSSRCRRPCSAWSTRRSAARPASTPPPARTWSARSTRRPACCATSTCCATLPAAELVNGLAEVVKAGFIADPAILDLVEADPAERRRPGLPTTARADRARRAGQGRRRRGDLTRDRCAGRRPRREILNYGHTLAHAIERADRLLRAARRRRRDRHGLRRRASPGWPAGSTTAPPTGTPDPPARRPADVAATAARGRSLAGYDAAGQEVARRASCASSCSTGWRSPTSSTTGPTRRSCEPRSPTGRRRPMTVQGAGPQRSQPRPARVAGEPEIYGARRPTPTGRAVRVGRCRARAGGRGAPDRRRGELLGWLHEAADERDRRSVLNPAAWTHYSYALRDACAQLHRAAGRGAHQRPRVAREEFRHNSVVAAVAHRHDRRLRPRVLPPGAARPRRPPDLGPRTAPRLRHRPSPAVRRCAVRSSMRCSDMSA